MSSRFDLYDHNVEAVWTDSSINKSNIGVTLREEAEMAENEGGMYYSGWALGERADAIEDLMRENKKLRESVRNLLTCVKHEECEESCPYYKPMYTDYGCEKNGSTVVESEYLGCCAVGLENCNSMFFDANEYLRELGIEE